MRKEKRSLSLYATFRFKFLETCFVSRNKQSIYVHPTISVFLFTNQAKLLLISHYVFRIRSIYRETWLLFKVYSKVTKQTHYDVLIHHEELRQIRKSTNFTQITEVNWKVELFAKFCVLFKYKDRRQVLYQTHYFITLLGS